MISEKSMSSKDGTSDILDAVNQTYKGLYKSGVLNRAAKIAHDLELLVCYKNIEKDMVIRSAINHIVEQDAEIKHLSWLLKQTEETLIDEN